MKLYFKDLPCRQETTPEGIERYNHLSNYAFNLNRLPNESLRNDFAAYIFDRASGRSIKSLQNDESPFHNMADFLTAYYPRIEHLTDKPMDELTNKLKRFLLKKGIKLAYSRHWIDYESSRPNHTISYLRKAYGYFSEDTGEFNKEHDKWRTITIPFDLRASPLNPDVLLDFSRIKQDELKREIKEAALYRLKRLSPNTVKAEIYSINRLSEFLLSRFPDITTLGDFTRDTLEEYLAYIYTNKNGRESYIDELGNIKRMFNTVAKLFDFDNLRGIILRSDFQASKNAVFKYYTEAELSRLHEGYKSLDKQTARLMLIHEFLGLRISDTLTLKTADVILTDEPHIIIHQPKTDKTYIKKINHEIAALLSASIEYDRENYGECEYIFVSVKDHSIPMKIATLANRLNAMIHNLDLRDDNGNLFTPGTHIFRHTYGKRLCDLLKDDVTIAALLGHTSVNSVSHYRQMSSKVLAEASKPVVDKRNEKIKKFKKGWME